MNKNGNKYDMIIKNNNKGTNTKTHYVSITTKN